MDSRLTKGQLKTLRILKLLINTALIDTQPDHAQAALVCLTIMENKNVFYKMANHVAKGLDEATINKASAWMSKQIMKIK